MGVPPSGLKITLPLMTSKELASLYKKDYDGHSATHAVYSSTRDWRPAQQANMIKKAKFGNATGLTIVEMGCARGYLLYNFRKQASRGGQLKCFEADPEQH